MFGSYPTLKSTKFEQIRAKITENRLVQSPEPPEECAHGAVYYLKSAIV